MYLARSRALHKAALAAIHLFQLLMARTSGGITKKSSTPRFAYALTTLSNPKQCECPVCGLCYASPASLYQHKRSKHPELISSRDTMTIWDEDDRRFECPECDKCYKDSAGLYQHKRAKHPWLINQRERGYTRPNMKRRSDLPPLPTQRDESPALPTQRGDLPALPDA